MLREEAQEKLGKATGMVSTLAAHVAQMQRALATATAEADELRRKYRKEAAQRRLLYNKIQEMKGNIRIFLRCRRDDRVPCVLTFVSENECMVPFKTGRPKLFEFDRVYGPDSSQELVYEDVSAIITSCIDGYNVCLLAYGQTGSGKTYTMMGTVDNPGVNRRAVKELFNICREREDYEYTISVGGLGCWTIDSGYPISIHRTPILQQISTHIITGRF